MPNSALSIVRIFTHGLFVLAALFIVFGPSLDTAAYAASRSDKTDQPLSRVLAAFDVIEDVTDHLPGNPPKTQSQQPLWAVAWLEWTEPVIEGPDAPSRDWTPSLTAPLISALSEKQDDPPRS